MKPHLLVLAIAVVVRSAAAGEPSPEPEKAGTTLQATGVSTVSRPNVPAAAPLKSRDPVFVHDRVATAEASLVRLLLGGKALVTVRERSQVTITDTPQHSAITLREGRLALGLAKSLLRPGEQVEVHTPNAIAGIRGSFLVAETYALNGVVETVFASLEVSKPIIVTLSDGSVQTLLGTNQTVRISGLGRGATMGAVRDLRPDEIARAAATASGPSLTDRFVGPPPELLEQIGAAELAPPARQYAPQGNVTVPSSQVTTSSGETASAPPPVVASPPPPTVLTPPDVRGLDRANQVAGPNGLQGRTNAATRQNR